MLAGGATKSEILRDYPYLQDQDITASGNLTDVVEYTFTLPDHAGVWTARVPLAQVQGGFGDFAVAGRAALIEALFAL